LYFCWHILGHFLDKYLKDGPAGQIATVNAFESGTNRWQHLPGWPAGCEHKALLPAPDGILAGAAAAHDLGRATAIGGQQNDARPPNMFLRTVSLCQNGFQLGAGLAVTLTAIPLSMQQNRMPACSWES
jgi:hypothetical protein